MILDARGNEINTYRMGFVPSRIATAAARKDCPQLVEARGYIQLPAPAEPDDDEDPEGPE